jgi:hypothetical protein
MSLRATSRRALASLAPWSFALVILAWLALDSGPRFFLGDSVTYLMAGEPWLPPDRSWAFGLAVNALLRAWRGYGGIILVQTVLLAAMIAAARPFFAEAPKAAFAATAALLAADPLIELSTRLMLSDLAAAALLVATLLPLLRLLQGRRPWAWGALAAAAGAAAPFVRVASLPIVEATVLLAALLSAGRITRRQAAALALAALGPPLGAAALAGTNRQIFGEAFLVRPAGVSLAAVFSPALRPEDFAAAGIAIEPAEYAALHLEQYGRRPAQVWSHHHDTLQQLLRDKLGVTAWFAPEVDRAAAALLRHALARDPLTVAGVYLRAGLIYADPRSWRDFAPTGLGLDRDLPAAFVAFSNQRTAAPIDAGLPRRLSPLVRLYLAVCPLYPLQLLLGAAAAGWLLLRRGRRPAIVVAAAALAADVAVAPLYSVGPSARYVLGAVFVAWLLIGLAAGDLAEAARRSRPVDRPAPPAGAGRIRAINPMPRGDAT